MAAPTGKGVTPVRSLRIPDDPWLPAKAKAARKGETITDVIVRALEAYNAEGEEATPKPVAKRNHSAAGTDRKPASLTRNVTKARKS